METSLLKHLVALFFMIDKGFIRKITEENPDIEDMKASIWHSYTYADFYIKTVEELHDPDKAKRKWSIPSAELKYKEKK